MAEIETPVFPVKVERTCPKDDCSGRMLPTGAVHTTNPPAYPHICTVCGVRESYLISYPTLRYKEVAL